MSHSGEDSPGLGIWVVRDDLNSKEKIKEVRELAQETGASRMYLQVVGKVTRCTAQTCCRVPRF